MSKRCHYCKVRDAVVACDEQLTGPRAGRVCGGALCSTCAHPLLDVEGSHLCPPHRRERERLQRLADEWLAQLVARGDAPAPEPVQRAPIMPPPPVELHENGMRCPWPECPKPPWQALPFCKVHWHTLPLRVRDMFDLGADRETALEEAGAWIASMRQQQAGNWNRAVSRARDKDNKRG